MHCLVTTIWKLKIWKDTRGQDMLEYALVAACIAVAWGAVSLGFASGAVTVFSKVSDALIKAHG